MDGYILENSRKLNTSELSHLNTALFGITFINANNKAYCKLFAKGSTTKYYACKLDPSSEIGEGCFFDITRCEVREYRQEHSSCRINMIYVPKEAKK